MALSPPQQQIEPYASLLEEQHLIEDLPGRDAPLRPQSHGRSAFVDPSLPASPLSTTPWRLLSDTRAFETLFKELCPYDVCVCIDHGVAVRAVRFLLLGCRQARSGHRRRAFRWTTGRVRGRAERREGPEAERNLIRLSDKIRTSPAPRNPDPSFLAVLVGQASFCRQMQSGVFVIPITELGSLRGARIQAPTWEQRRFSDTLEFMRNNTLSRAELSEAEGTVLNVHYGDVLVRFGEILNVDAESLPRIADDSIAMRLSCQRLANGDVVIADTAEDAAVGKCSELRGCDGKQVVSGLHTMACRPLLEFAVGYLGYYLNSNAFHAQLLPLMQGIKVISISKTAIGDAAIRFPSLAEQSRIGALFRTLDSLITLHQREGLCGKY